LDKPEPLAGTVVRTKEPPLRILIIINLPWDPRLGAVHVWAELAEQWKTEGHIVEKFCLSDAYPRLTSSRGLGALRQAWFPYRAGRFVRQNAHRFDVIDCLIGTLPFSRKKLGFRGLLVARSVGLYRSYEHFIRRIRERWPDQPRGKILGRVFYRFTEGLLRRNSNLAIRSCDLINVPNEDEIQFLQEAGTQDKPAIVQPYGLSDRARSAFDRSMESPEERLRRKEICFIGMWSLRKGSRDWPALIEQIRREIPDARFQLLGTMTDEATVLNDLRLASADGVRCVPTYEPAELPGLLSSCAVGLFPSYIEGFGIAVLEQLASGIPTICYDVPGPRQILETDRADFLVPPGDVRAMADRAVKILKMQPGDYARLSDQSRAKAQPFRWEHIAADTIRQYRQALASSQRIVFMQPFGMASITGGGRVLRSLLRDAPVPSLSICTSPAAPKEKYPGEIHLPVRPSFGRIEHTRLTALPHSLAPLFSRRFFRKLETTCRAAQACAIHAIAHGGIDFFHGYRLSRKLRLPFFLQVHDDVIYTGAGKAPRERMSRCLAEAWRGAEARFVISHELGREYNERYGEREFLVVTDGLDRVAPEARPATGQLRVYFMGLFHLVYERNLESVMKALELVPPDADGGQPRSMTLRCGGLRPALLKNERLIRLLPYGTELDVERDFSSADLLYLPLPFGEEYRAFGAYSLSTKMVSYLGSGIPILYHGPPGTAAYNLLCQNRAAIFATSLDAGEVAAVLAGFLRDHSGPVVAANALSLVRRDFLRREKHDKFWQRVLECLHPGATRKADQ
jgi:glycosyltransferase involved in cell wall biosynthesis